MKAIERENTYLLKQLPTSLIKNWSKEFVKDIYYPPYTDNPQIRLRQRGSNYYLTKKYPLKEGYLSEMVEESIHLSQEEKLFLETSLKGKGVSKNRYSKEFTQYILEVDEYLEELKPLLVLDIEWKDSYSNPQEILKLFEISCEITNKSVLAAGKIAGKTYDEIKIHL